MKIIFRRFSITGLLLAAVSGITMTVSTKRDTNIQNNGVVVMSDNGLDITCIAADTDLFMCTYTVIQPGGCLLGDLGSRTSTDIANNTSSITSLGCFFKERTISSVFNVAYDEVTFNEVPTSADADNYI